MSVSRQKVADLVAGWREGWNLTVRDTTVDFWFRRLNEFGITDTEVDRLNANFRHAWQQTRNPKAEEFFRYIRNNWRPDNQAERQADMGRQADILRYRRTDDGQRAYAERMARLYRKLRVAVPPNIQKLLAGEDGRDVPEDEIPF